MTLDFNIPPADELERRKQLVRDVWEYKKVDHIPIMMDVAANPWGYTMTEQMVDRDKQLRLRLESVKRSLPIPDYIPTMRVDVGCIPIASAFGAKVKYGLHPDQTPYVEGPLIQDIEEVYSLGMPDPETDGLLPEGIGRIKYFVEQTEGKVHVSLLDLNGPLNCAMDLLGAEKLYIAMHKYPEALHHLLNLLTETLITVIDRCLKAAGGYDNITATDFPGWWFPEGKKGHVSDDACANMAPRFFESFSIPYNNRILDFVGPGQMHNCGPNPSAHLYLKQPKLLGVNLAYNYSKDDLVKFRDAFDHKAVIYLILENDWQENLKNYRHAMEVLAPKVIAVPCLTVNAGEDVMFVYNKFLEISKEYASRMDW